MRSAYVGVRRRVERFGFAAVVVALMVLALVGVMRSCNEPAPAPAPTDNP